LARSANWRHIVLTKGSPAAPIWALPSLGRLTRVALQSPDGRPRDEVHVSRLTDRSWRLRPLRHSD
jgi:hypothetical protein